MKSAIPTVMIALLLSAPVASAEVVGYNHIAVPANSDVRLTIPFSRQIVGTFTVLTKTGTGVTVAGPLTAGAFANTHYVRFISGTGRGLWSTVSANGTTSIDFENEDVLPHINAGDTFRVYQHQTLGTVFPPSLLNVAYLGGTQVLIYKNDVDAMVQNKSADKVATYNAGTSSWAGAGGVNNNTVLPPETQFILRNNAGGVLNVYTLGRAPDFTVSQLIAPSGDIVTGSGYAVPVVLKQANLGGSGRQVLFYDNSATGKNKSAVKVATWNPATQKWAGAGVTGEETIGPSEMITLRLSAGEAATKVIVATPY